VAMKFGAGEVLEIDSWGRKRQYDAICKVSDICHTMDDLLRYCL
jgi:hypothetical protein